jgi:predicted outer membrane repeat protein
MRSTPIVHVLVIALLSGCPSDPTGGIVAISAERLDFGEVNVGLESALSFTITNDRLEGVDIFSVTLLEGSEAVWRVDRDPLDRLEPGAVLTVTVTFTPFEEGRDLGRVQVRSSDDANASLFVVLEGTGGPSVRDEDEDGFSPLDGDCDDNDPDRYPGAKEICDGVDNDCDGERLPEELDEDDDGFALCDGDCNDADPNIYPGAVEICDDADSDCDGFNGDNEDLDLDGFTPCQGDCDDDEPSALPPSEGAPEICDEVDNDCNGEIDDLDADFDGHSPCAAGGDCDDGDPAVFPVVVDPEAPSGGDGTDEAPYDDLSTALDNLDDVCRTAVLAPGEYGTGYVIVGGDPITLVGEDTATVTFTGARAFTLTAGADVTLRRMTISGAETNNDDGGAISADGSSLTLDDVNLHTNTCTGDGGAVSIFSGTLTVLGSTFTGNSAGDDGGAVSMVSGSLFMTNATFTGNNGSRGGALLLDGTLVQISDSLFSGNTATADGGAIMLTATPSVEIERVQLFSNDAGLRGGALAATNVSDADGFIRNLHVSDNESGGTGGGLYFGGAISALLLANSTFTTNTALGAGGGVHIDADDASGMVCAGNLVTWSTAASGFEVRSGVGGTYFSNTAFATAGVEVDFVGDIVSGENDNTVANPQYGNLSLDADPTNDDLSLNNGSPAIDSGPLDDAGPGFYPSWNDTDGSRNDRGATGGPGA